MTTSSELLDNALWLCTQVRQLHELSFEMGRVHGVADPGSAQALHRGCLTIMDASSSLAGKIAKHLEAEKVETRPHRTLES